ncbi:hypothetical protein RRG08_032515 [Elysia crispata]|uniref:Uncharacterized protein n=1 Tax=Elysia crispata TaxID=231223 RepID=A0AAE0ZYN0_9GAST|nr:hypothetical protein RRG08_032515 [Elysia crispata]
MKEKFRGSPFVGRLQCSSSRHKYHPPPSPSSFTTPSVGQPRLLQSNLEPSTSMAGHGPSRHNTTSEDCMMPILQLYLYQHGRTWTVKTQYHL